MNLHRTASKPEWAGVKDKDLNYWQRLAKRTDAVVTPGNILTFLGLVIVIIGAHEILLRHFWAAFILLIIGRLLDIFDGIVADKTHTKSQVGEMYDASCDRVAAFVTILALFIARVGSPGLLVVVILPPVLTSLVVVGYRFKGIKFPASPTGKISVALTWIYFVGLVLIEATGSASHSFLTYVVYAVAYLAIASGLYALVGYIQAEDQRKD